MQVFFIRANQNWGNHDFYPRLAGDDDAGEVMQAFLGQFYSDRDPPPLILASCGVDDPEVLMAALSEKAKRRIDIAVPQRGEKAELVEGALRNAF